jgi:hypothetical protein
VIPQCAGMSPGRRASPRKHSAAAELLYSPDASLRECPEGAGGRVAHVLVTYPDSMRLGSSSSSASSTASEGSLRRVRLQARQTASSTASIASSLGDGRLCGNVARWRLKARAGHGCGTGRRATILGTMQPNDDDPVRATWNAGSGASRSWRLRITHTRSTLAARRGREGPLLRFGVDTPGWISFRRG